MDPDELLQVLDRPRPDVRDHKAVPTGSLGLDLALGGGWPSGRICELIGESGSGKTTLAHHAAARAQESGTVLWLDSGHFDPQAAAAAGVDLDRMLLSRPTEAGHALWHLGMAAPRAVLMVVDSASGLDVPETSLAYELGQVQRDLRKHGATALFVSNFKVSEGTTGTFSTMLRASSSVRVKLQRRGPSTRALVAKNTLTPPATFPAHLRFADGQLDWAAELVALGLQTGVLKMRGSWIFTEDIQLGLGAAQAANTIRRSGTRGQFIREAVVRTITGGTPCP